MGCKPGKSTVLPSADLQGEKTNQILSERQRKIVCKTWKYMANDLTGKGSKVFLRIFELYPHVKQLFPGLRDEEGEELLKNANFKGHASRFMQAVGAVVDNVDDPETALSPLLIGLGRQHVTFVGFEPSYFDAFTEGMMFVWERELGHKFSPEVADAWKLVFDFLMTKLREGHTLALRDKEARDEEEKNRVVSIHISNAS